MVTRLSGLVAATFTPMNEDGTIRFEAIEPMVATLSDQGIAALYVLGSTGEGPSLTFDERCAAAVAFISAAANRLPVMVQVGSECLRQSRLLATHAEQSGAAAISAVSPVYFKPDSVATLVAAMAEIASGAPTLPFYYYHIPTITGVAFSVVDFLEMAAARMPTFRGIKFTSQNVFEFQSCVEAADDRFEILWGLDEMLQCGLAAGAVAAVGSTYNFAAPIYQRLLAAFAAGDMETVRLEQSRSQAIVRTFIPFGSRGAQKAIMRMIGIDCGPSRLPISTLTSAQYAALETELRSIGFFEWLSQPGSVMGVQRS